MPRLYHKWAGIAILLLLIGLLDNRASAQPVITSGQACVLAYPQEGDNTTALQAAVAKAAATDARCLVLSPGAYGLAAPTQAGPILTLAADGLTISGHGAVLQWADDIVYPAGWTDLFHVTAAAVRIHDLTIQGGVAPSGPGNWTAVECTLGCVGGQFTDLDISGVYGANTAGGAGIDVYTPWDQGGYSGALVENNYIHDSAHSTAITLDSWGSTVRSNKIVRVGSRVTEQGVYLQGGRNVVEGNWVEAVGGYSFHGHKQTPHADATGDVLRDNVSINPGAGHVVFDTYPNDVNPAFPPGTPLDQGDLITGNSFLGTLTATNTIGVWANGVPVRVVNNLFRDATVGYTWLDTHLATGSLISGNQFVSTRNTQTAYILWPGPDNSITGNAWQGAQAGYGVQLTDGDQFTGNIMDVLTGTWPIQLVGGATISGNTIRSANNPTVQILPGAHGWTITGNTLSSTDRWALRLFGDNAGTLGTLSGNTITGGVVQLAIPGVSVSGNRGVLAYDSGLPALPSTPDAGALRAVPFSANLGAGQIVTWQGAGVAPAPPNASRWSGVALSATYGGAGTTYVAQQPGAVLVGVCGADSVPVGHVATVGTQAGCLQDAGTDVPNGSYVRSLGGGEVELHP